MSMSYTIPDITGTNTDYLQVNVPSHIYKVGQKIAFENSPVFADTLTIAPTDGTGRVLVLNVDYEIQDDDIDETAMARAFLENAGFTKTLVKSVTIVSETYVTLRVAMTYQEFYLTNPGRTFDDGRPFEISVDFIKNLATRVGLLGQQVARVNSPVVSSPTVPALLTLDINKELSANVISGETVQINTVGDNKVILPAQGAFFADSLTLSFDGTPLVATTDYLPILLSPLTKQSTNVSGIYQGILITKELSGEVTVGYHAVGGAVQRDDIRAVYNLMAGIRDYLDGGTFITADTIVDTVAFRAFAARLNLLEEDMRRLLTGTPTYGDSSSNNAVTRPISAVDSDFHWWTIASLYKVEGSNDIIRADQFKGRVYLPTAKVALAFTVDVNIDQDRLAASMRTDSLVFDPGYVLFGDLSVAEPQWPMVRVVYNNSADSFSGAYIQVGVPLPSLSDMMVVEDFSSPESCWVMSRANEFVTGQTVVNPTGASDSGFVLPDGVSMWAESSEISHSVTLVPDYKDGYLAYTGSSVKISDLVTTSSTASLFTVRLPKAFPIASIKTLLVTLLSADSETVYDVAIPITGTDTDVRVGRQNFSDSELEAMMLSAKVTNDTYGNPKLELYVSELSLPLVSGEASAQTDIVRYIRVKV